MNSKFNAAVFIGRFQPFHNGHLYNIQEALKIANRVIVVVGSSLEPRTYKNPFSFAERAEMIISSLPEADRARVGVVPVKDSIYNEVAWATAVQRAVNSKYAEMSGESLLPADTAIIGYEKDKSTYYLKLFPQWKLVKTALSGDLNATDIRSLFFRKNPEFRYCVGVMPEAVVEFLKQFHQTDAFTQVLNERNFIEKYKRQYESLPYPPIFVTTDAVVVCAGHVLMIKRKSFPGKGLWALPGGFVNANTDSSILSAMLRELREETRIAVPAPVIEGSIAGSRVFDAIDRSARGRTITHAFAIRLKDSTLPKVKGADDAELAKWIPIANISSETCFEDHYDIIQWAVSL